MADNSRHRGGRRRVASLAALGLLAGTTWLLLAHPGLPSHAVGARATSPQSAPPGPGVPVRLRIPALGLRTSIEPVGLRAGAMDVPTNVWDVGWFQLGPRPGDVGNAVIDGHLDSTTGPAVFL